MRGAVITGAVAALVVTAAMAGGAWWWSRGNVPTGKVTHADRIVVMMAGPAEDGATVAQIVAVVDVSGSTLKVTDVDPDMRITIAGTTFDRLRDTYAFGGGPAVAQALARVQGTATLPYLVVPSQTWSNEPSGTASLDVLLPQRVDVFDGTRLTTFPQGEARVAPVDLPYLMQGVDYLGAPDRVKVRAAVADSFVRKLGKVAVAPSKVQTDLSAQGLDAFLLAVETRSH
jgi:hypothetical protein